MIATRSRGWAGHSHNAQSGAVPGGAIATASERRFPVAMRTVGSDCRSDLVVVIGGACEYKIIGFTSSELQVVHVVG
jgi:hypothetical protein